MPRPVTRFLCRWVPRRSVARRYTKADAARIICYAISDGASREEIFTESQVKCPDHVEGSRRAQAQALAAAANPAYEVAVMAIQYAASMDPLLSDILKQLLILLGILIAFGTLVAAAPIPGIIKRPVIVSLRLAEQNLRLFQGRVITQKAANDSFIELMREVIRKAA